MRLLCIAIPILLLLLLLLLLWLLLLLGRLCCVAAIRAVPSCLLLLLLLLGLGRIATARCCTAAAKVHGHWRLQARDTGLVQQATLQLAPTGSCLTNLPVANACEVATMIRFPHLPVHLLLRVVLRRVLPVAAVPAASRRPRQRHEVGLVAGGGVVPAVPRRRLVRAAAAAATACLGSPAAAPPPPHARTLRQTECGPMQSGARVRSRRSCAPDLQPAPQPHSLVGGAVNEGKNGLQHLHRGVAVGRNHRLNLAAVYRDAFPLHSCGLVRAGQQGTGASVLSL